MNKTKHTIDKKTRGVRVDSLCLGDTFIWPESNKPRVWMVMKTRMLGVVDSMSVGCMAIGEPASYMSQNPDSLAIRVEIKEVIAETKQE